MSWTFQLENINRSFERLALWYKDFMHRTETCFQELHQRITYLEEHQPSNGPTDEQVERVLRKILAERFAAPGEHFVERAHFNKADSYFVENPKGLPQLRSIPFDPASLVVDPDSVPSQAYVETFQMLESRIARFPHLNGEEPEQPRMNTIKEEIKIEIPRGSVSD